jgi:hypothetical protein
LDLEQGRGHGIEFLRRAKGMKINEFAKKK